MSLGANVTGSLKWFVIIDGISSKQAIALPGPPIERFAGSVVAVGSCQSSVVYHLSSEDVS